MNLKLLRLRSGEDVICEIIKESAEYIKIKNPAMLMPMSDGRGNAVKWVWLLGCLLVSRRSLKFLEIGWW